MDIVWKITSTWCVGGIRVDVGSSVIIIEVRDDDGLGQGDDL